MKTKTEKLFHGLRLAGLPTSFQDENIIELEFDRDNSRFPSKYTILGLRIEDNDTVSFSIEPMHKPAKGDARPDSWRDGEEPIARELVLGVLSNIGVIFDGLGLKLGNEVSEIFATT